ncbi:ionotropic receptor 75a-like [Uranotaenia lowii]|uniref:ionotropic receptor 75a-like n=1 Tax=Uranotaenia lowii TaxID=190385 RepID=UPI00247861C2|nr:ionotropic receptor 75a-like [Uranotaenia lowii]
MVVDGQCSKINGLLDWVSDHSYFNESYWWYIDGFTDLNDALCILEGKKINIDSKIMMAIATNTSMVNVYEVYGTIQRRGGRLHEVLVGQWDPTNGAKWRRSSYSYATRSNLDGLMLRAVFSPMRKLDLNLLKFMERIVQPRSYRINIYGYRLSRLLSYHLNFSIQFIIAQAISYESIRTNSTIGIIGQLQHNLVDFSASPLSYMKDRMSLYQPTIEMMTAKIVAIFRHPKKQNGESTFFKPFEKHLWIAMATLLIFSVIMLMTASFFHLKKQYSLDTEYFFALLGFFLQQCFSGTFATRSQRLTVVSLLLFCILIYEFYCSFIISYILLPTPKTIKTSQQLLESNLEVSFEDLSYNKYFLNITRDITLIKIYHRKILPNKYAFVNVTDGLALVKKGGYAFNCDTSYAYTWILDMLDDDEICELQEVQLYPLLPLHVVTPIGSPLREIFRVSLQRFLETGLSQYHRNKIRTEKPICQAKSFSASQVDFEEIQSLCWILGIALCATVLMLIGEILTNRLAKCIQRKVFREKGIVWTE